MKWFGAEVQNGVAEFDDDIYFNTLATTTETSVLVVDSRGLVSKSEITTLAGLTSFGSAGATTNILAGDIDWYNPVTNGNPTFRMGVDVNECFRIKSFYQSGTQSMQIAHFITSTASGTADDGRFQFHPDDVKVLSIDDGGIDFEANMGISINGTDILTDSSGTATLSNIDALDATTVSTLNSALTAGDITGVVAGDGLSGGGDAGAVTLNVDEVTIAQIGANNAKNTNVTTNLTATTHASQITINSSDGTNVIVAEASGSIAGVMSVTHHDKLDGIETSATADQSKSDIDGLAITTVGTIDTGTWQSSTAVIASAYLDADTAHLSGAQTFTGTKTLNSFKGTAGATVTNILDEDAMGSNSATALATQQSIKAYIDTTKLIHALHYPFRGFCTGISSGNFQYPEDMLDAQFPVQLNTDYGDTVIANGDLPDVSTYFRSGGVVMPRAGSAVDMVGWASCPGTGEVTISLCKITPTRDDLSTEPTPVVVATTTFTALGDNDKLENFFVGNTADDGQVTIVTAAVAKGDILMPFVLSPNTKTMYFNMTLEVTG